MKISEAIEKAIEGGWEDNARCSCISPKQIIEIAFLDPLFWSALGKSMGWEKKECPYPEHDHPKEYVFYWKRLIDHLAKGKDITSFFEQFKET